jgi:hypothetical protein
VSFLSGQAKPMEAKKGFTSPTGPWNTIRPSRITSTSSNSSHTYGGDQNQNQSQTRMKVMMVMMMMIVMAV